MPDFLEINSVGFAVKGVQVVEIVAQLLDFQEFLGLSAAKTKEIKAAGLES